MTDLTDLIAAIEAATGPDRVLDERIAEVLGWKRRVVVINARDETHWDKPDGSYSYGTPDFTGSLDAARGTFGDYDYSIVHITDWPAIELTIWDNDGFGAAIGFSATEPLAMLSASMRLKAQEG